jgi:hypothetical protein
MAIMVPGFTWIAPRQETLVRGLARDSLIIAHGKKVNVDIPADEIIYPSMLFA